MRRTKTGICLAISLSCALVFSLLFYSGFYSNIQLKLSDNLYGGRNALDSAVIIAIDDKSLQEIGRWPWNRENFAEIVNFLNESKVVGIDVAFFEESDKETDAKLAEAMKNSHNVVIPVEYTSFENLAGRVVGRDMLYPVGELGKYAEGLGYVNVVTDGDGVTRAVNLDVSDKYSNFAETVYRLYWKNETVKRTSRFLVNFVGKPGSFKYYSFTDLVHGRVNKSVFKGKLVFIGATSPDMHDDYFVPTSGGKAMPGVEIHANTVQTMITHRFLGNEPKWLVILSLFVFAAIVAVIVDRLHIWLSGAISFALFFIYALVSIKIFDFGVIMNFVYIPVVILFSYISVLAYSYVTEQKSKKKIMGAFGKYVSPIIVEQIAKHPDKLKLGGEKRNVTILFSDIRGFTSISEKLKPEQLVRLLNEYLSAMTTIILKHDGLVDKYIGDAIMAFWNAPLNQPKHARLACSAAVEMIKKLGEIQEKWKKEKLPHIDIGVGLNTGDAVIGNMGSYDRFDYTAIGDNINLGSRLEGLTKQYGVRIIISEATYAQVKNEFAARKLDLVSVKGRTKPIFIYELICAKKELTKKQEDAIRHYESGLNFYFARKWDSAIKEFLKVNDKPSEEFIQRCRNFKKSPPQNGWDGTWVMKTK